jgi:hypothetical protein
MDQYAQDTKAPFNMAIATLLSLRKTLDDIRDIEGRIDYPAEERQRIKIELVKRFYVDSSPLIFKREVLDKYKDILNLEPHRVVCINRNNQKQTPRIKYSFELNKKMDEFLLNLQIELQKNKYYMPPTEDMGSAVGRMS